MSVSGHLFFLNQINVISNGGVNLYFCLWNAIDKVIKQYLTISYVEPLGVLIMLKTQVWISNIV